MNVAYDNNVYWTELTQRFPHAQAILDSLEEIDLCSSQIQIWLFKYRGLGLGMDQIEATLHELATSGLVAQIKEPPADLPFRKDEYSWHKI